MLALIAGTGRLPALLCEELDLNKQVYYLCELDGFPIENRSGRPVIRFRIEQLGGFFDTLKEKGVTQICMAGAVQRPVLNPDAFDATSASLMQRLGQAMQAGDDHTLREIIAIFEEQGFDVIGAEAVRPDLFPAEGVLSKIQPDEQDRFDSGRAMVVHKALAAADVGQACIVSHGQVLGVESAAGTDWMIKSITDPSQVGHMLTGLPTGGVLFKAAKPDQDRRVDMATIGSRTLELAARAGLKGVVVQAQGIFVLDLDDVIRDANALGLFLWVREGLE